MQLSKVTPQLISSIKESDSKLEVEELLKNIDFQNDDVSINDILSFIKQFGSDKNFSSVFTYVAAHYNFNSSEEKLLFVTTVYEQQQICIVPEQLIKSVRLNYADAVLIAREFKHNNLFISRYIVSNADTLSSEEKLNLIAIELEGSTSVLEYCHQFKLTADQITKLYNGAKSFEGLVPALRGCGWEKAEIIRFIEEIMAQAEAEHTHININELFLTTEEIVNFVNEHNGWGHVLDNWVDQHSNITGEELLKLRLNTSEYRISMFTLCSMYRVPEENLANIVEQLPENASIDQELCQYLSWDAIYKRCKYYSQESEDGVMSLWDYIDCENFDPVMKDFLLELSDIDGIDIDELTLTAADDIENLFSKLHETINRKMLEILEIDTDTNDALLTKIKEHYIKQTKPGHNILPRLITFLCLISLYFRLLNETDRKNLKYALNQEIFIQTIIEMSALAAPRLRLTLIENIIKLVNNHSSLDTFCKLPAKTSKRHLIPALIIFSSINEASLHSEFLSIIERINKNYTDNNKMVVLINGLLSLFSNNLLSSQDKLSFFAKVFMYDLLLVDELPSADKADFNKAYISKGYGLLAVTINGDILRIEDVRDNSNARLENLSYTLQALTKNKKDWANNLPPIKAALGSSELFAIGVKSELQALLMLQGLSAINKLAVLIQEENFSKKSWMQNYAYVLQLCFSLSENQLPLTLTQLEDCHSPFSIVAYYRQLSLLKNPQPFLKLLSQFVSLISSPNANEFYNYRYDLTQQPQLQAVIGSDLNLLTKWREGKTKDLEQFLIEMKTNKTTFEREKIDPEKFIIDRVTEHLSKNKFAIIHNYLAADTPLLKDKILQNAKSSLEKFGNEVLYYHRSNLKKEINLQVCLIEFLTKLPSITSDLAKVKELKKLLDIVNHIPSCTQFYQDLSRLIVSLSQKEERNVGTNEIKAVNKSLIVDTDHFWHMFMMGTDVIGSCQNINGTPDLNCCLIGGYVLSGHIRMIAIISAETRKIIARAVLRLMLDEVSKEPVLFLEKPYPDLGSQVDERAIIDFAISRAEELGCNLVTYHSYTELGEYPNTLRVECVKQAEYVDALNGKQQSGYSIKGSQWLYKSMPKPILAQATSNLQENDAELEFSFRTYLPAFNRNTAIAAALAVNEIKDPSYLLKY